MRRPKVEHGVLVYPLRDKWSRWASSTCICVYLYKPNSGRISTPVETGKRRKRTCNWTHSAAPLFYISILTQGEVQPLSWTRIASCTRRASAPIPVHIVAKREFKICCELLNKKFSWKSLSRRQVYFKEYRISREFSSIVCIWRSLLVQVISYYIYMYI